MGELIKEQAKKTVGQSIKILRIKNGWNQEYIANRLGISIPALSKIETGVTDVNLSRLEQIANIYEVTLAQLVNVYNDELEPIVLNGDTLRQKLREQETEIFALQRKVIELYEELRTK
jgi:transcriptional regulator with XRE-family HTH domain